MSSRHRKINYIQREQLFIVTELVFLLEQFAEGCVGVAGDSGDDNEDDERVATQDFPSCDLTGIAVLASLGEQRAFTLETLIDILQEAQRSGAALGAEREHSMELAVNILASFIECSPAAIRH